VPLTYQEPTAAADNGTGGAGAEVDAARAAAVSALERMVAVHAVERDKLKARLAEIEPEIKSAEKALAALRGEPLGHPQGKRAYNKTKSSESKSTGVSDERLALVTDAITSYTAAGHDEFRQVDIRGVVDVTSGVTALAFEALRQRGAIRLARQDGNNKWYRLTREALRES
jgi:hypothetical protein